MNNRRPCRNCQQPYDVHIDYTFTENLGDGSLTEALAEALPNIKCTFYKPMSNLEYLEYESTKRP